MVLVKWTVTIKLWTMLLTCVYGATYEQVKTEYTKLVEGYTIVGTANGDPYSQTVPTNSLPMEVTLTLNIFSLGGFDPVSGTIDIVGSLHMEWIDEIAIVNSPTISFDTATVQSFLVDYRLVWTPVIVLINSANSVQRIGDPSYKVRYETATGKVTWEPRMILKATCKPDVSFFPFDEQQCVLTFQSWIHDSSLIQLQTGSSYWGTDDFENNGIWTMEKTKSRVDMEGGYYKAVFEINIRRNALYFTINIVFPVLLLAALSGCLFLLPAASGERVGFGIICFLSFVVLLQVTMSFLPEASAPMSILCYYVILMMTLTAVLSIVNVLLIKVHMAEEGVPLPKWLVHFVEIVKCTKFKRWRQNRARRQSDLSLVSSSDVERADTDFGRSSSNFESQNSALNRRNRRVCSRSEVEKETSGSVMERRENARNQRYDIGGSCTSLSRTNSFIDSEPGHIQITRQRDDCTTIDWLSIGKFLDFFFLLVFLSIQAVLSVFFLAPLALRAA